MKSVIDNIIRIFKPIYIYFFERPYKRIQTNSGINAPMVYVSYLTKPFRKLNDKAYLNRHQNRRETILIDNILESLNLITFFERFDRHSRISSEYDIIFGLEPNFIRASKNNPNALKIYYATGAYYKHQNKMVLERTKKFNDTHGTNVTNSRLAPIHSSAEIADFIIQIGSKYTIETYPMELRSKIITIRQTCHEFRFGEFLNRKLEFFNRNEFVWMGSKGSILKGFDLTVDYFINHPNLELHIVGPIDSDVLEFYNKDLEKTENIHVHGFLDLDSSKLEEIALKSAFIIMPSASEGGCPGSVINMMKLGCIPIVTKYAAFDEINEYGYLIKGFSLKDIDYEINKISQLSPNDIAALIQKNYFFANQNFNRENFIKDMTHAVTKALKSHNLI